MKNDIIIRNGKLIFPERGEILKGDLRVKEEKIKEIIPSGKKMEYRGKKKVIEAEGFYVSPGFLDLQVNGGAGVDFLDPRASGVRKFSDLWASHGTTSFLATIITNPIELMNESMRAIQSFDINNCLGFHVEGPFISNEKRGAHDENYIKPYSKKSFERLTEEVKESIEVHTFAPEVAKTPELIRDLSSIHSVPSIGHTDASYAECLKALGEGAKGFTHLYNAMKGFHHRVPGCVGAALDSEAYFGLVVDGHHVHPAGVRLATRAEALDRVCLITDAISASGMPPGKHTLGDRSIFVEEDVARLPDGTIAGSVLTMDKAVKNTSEFTSLNLLEVVKMATLNPANFIGVGENKGTLKQGTDADLTVFDDQIRVEYTILGGEIAYERDGG
ncbi:MAG: N-acetylglucosamine-6-phosphate deacetylase [Candidatus Bipolaricaulota bacterium]|nr:N-acetylglucosamine-6-phosphate deacetylase [Candidatus Bipolaricaulota bacterium]